MAKKQSPNASERLYNNIAKVVKATPQFCKDLIYNTRVEILIGAALFGTALGIHRYDKEAGKAGQIPTAFSEIEYTERQLGYYDLDVRDVAPLTYFYSISNDTYMKVFEANNIAHKRNLVDRYFNSVFAHELEFKMDPSFRVHAQIPEYVSEIDGAADRALQSLDKLVQAEKDLPGIIDALDAAWEDDHNDVYRTEFYTVTTTDADGNTHTETRTRQVYDHTVHTYDFNKAAAIRSVQLLNDFIQKHPDLNITEELLPVTQTGAENEYAMEQSMREEFNNKIPTPEQAIEKANTWLTGSTFTTNIPDVYTNHHGAKVTSPKWDVASKKGKNHRYSTYSSSDAGPQEFQIAERALDYAVATLRHSQKITGGINAARQNMTDLEQAIVDYIDVELNHKPGNARKLKRKILKIAREGYDINFDGGFDTRPSKWGMAVLFGVIGIVVGAGVGAGADYLIDQNRTRRGRPIPNKHTIRRYQAYRQEKKKKNKFRYR